MKNLNTTTGLPRRSLLASAIALGLVAGPAAAVDLSSGEVSIILDTTVSYSMGMRVEDAIR